MADDFVRVKDTATGNEFTASAEGIYATDTTGRFKVVDKPTLGEDGVPLAAKHDPLRPTAKKAEESK